MLESWLCLMQQCPRHFRLSREVLAPLTTYALPAAGEHGSGGACLAARQLARGGREASSKPCMSCPAPCLPAAVCRLLPFVLVVPLLAPPAVKRMGQEQLAALAVLARDIALHRSDADMQARAGGGLRCGVPRLPGQ